uniref:Borealin C-terminal domain-containing protein n=1 Tax=Rhipicephalus appendiculatus TaxID=34631 RepID=A0A131YET7_RHIAP
MPRTKKPKPRQSSLLPGTALGVDQIKYLECMVRELECTLESSRLAMQEKVDRICRNADLWYDRIIRTVPEEILKRPFREVWDTAVPITNISATSSLSVPSTSADTETSLDTNPLTATRARQRALVASAKAKKAASQRRSTVSKKTSDVAPGAPKSAKKARKVSLRTPLVHTHSTAGRPVVTPKFNIRKRPPSARPVRRGETLMSLSGSPVEAKPSAVPIHVHINNGQVVKVTARDSSLNELCKAIKTLCDKM